MGEDHRILTRGFGGQLTIGGFGPRRKRKEYEFVVLGSVEKEELERYKIYSPLEKKLKSYFNIFSAIEKDINEEFRIKSRIDVEKILNLLDNL